MKTVPINDLKLAAFLRTVAPSSFSGVTRSDSGKVAFLFNESSVQELITQYLMDADFTFSPLKFAHQLDECKKIIFSDLSI